MMSPPPQKRTTAVGPLWRPTTFQASSKQRRRVCVHTLLTRCYGVALMRAFPRTLKCFICFGTVLPLQQLHLCFDVQSTCNPWPSDQVLAASPFTCPSHVQHDDDTVPLKDAITANSVLRKLDRLNYQYSFLKHHVMFWSTIAVNQLSIQHILPRHTDPAFVRSSNLKKYATLHHGRHMFHHLLEPRRTRLKQPDRCNVSAPDGFSTSFCSSTRRTTSCRIVTAFSAR